jgi:hypothetical protein
MNQRIGNAVVDKNILLKVNKLQNRYNQFLITYNFLY